MLMFNLWNRNLYGRANDHLLFKEKVSSKKKKKVFDFSKSVLKHISSHEFSRFSEEEKERKTTEKIKINYKQTNRKKIKQNGSR